MLMSMAATDSLGLHTSMLTEKKKYKYCILYGKFSFIKDIFPFDHAKWLRMETDDRNASEFHDNNIIKIISP